MEVIAVIVMDPVIGRDSSGQHGGVARQSLRNRGDCIFKQNSFCGNSIDIGCGFRFVSVAAEMVGPAGVDTDEKDIANIFW